MSHSWTTLEAQLIQTQRAPPPTPQGKHVTRQRLKMKNAHQLTPDRCWRATEHTRNPTDASPDIPPYRPDHTHTQTPERDRASPHCPKRTVNPKTQVTACTAPYIPPPPLATSCRRDCTIDLPGLHPGVAPPLCSTQGQNTKLCPFTLPDHQTVNFYGFKIHFLDKSSPCGSREPS